MKARVKRQVRTRTRKLLFLQEELEDAGVTFEIYRDDFELAVALARPNVRVEQDLEKYCDNIEKAREQAHEQALAVQQEAEEAVPDDPSDDEKTPDRPGKGLYKSIARQTHPDRHLQMGVTDADERARLSGFFTEAHDAFTRGALEVLVRIGLQLGMDPEDMNMSAEKLMGYIDKEVLVTLSKIKNFQSSYAWVWGEADEDIPRRVQILLQFLSLTGHDDLDEVIVRDVVERHAMMFNDDGTRRTRPRARKSGERPGRILRQPK